MEKVWSLNFDLLEMYEARIPQLARMAGRFEDKLIGDGISEYHLCVLTLNLFGFIQIYFRSACDAIC